MEKIYYITIYDGENIKHLCQKLTSYRIIIIDIIGNLIVVRGNNQIIPALLGKIPEIKRISISINLSTDLLI